MDIHGSAAEDNLGMCRKNAPVCYRAQPDDTRGTWPQVEGADWCGEYVPKTDT